MSDRIMNEALSWHGAQARDDMDWEAFAEWLEADPRHRAAYDDVALIDTAVDRHRETLRPLLPAVEEKARQHRWYAVAGVGIAAALALVIGAPMLRQGAPAPADYRTGAGETRTIALNDGSTILLSASSHLRVSGTRQDDLTLEGGAYFDVPHDPARTMRIHVGGYEVSDIGTRFDITASHMTLRVAVAEGRLSVGSAALATPVVLTAGHRLLVEQTKGKAEVEPVHAADVGSWRSGRLVYDNVPLSLVAADISRYAGQTVTVAPDIAGQRFSGVLAIGDGSGLVSNLQQFMDLQASVKGDHVRLDARGR